MVGLLYLPRLFVYHNDTKNLSEMDKTFLLMEYRLLNYIMTPALVITYVLGFVLLSSIFFLVPNLFNSLDGVLFPITYMLYIIYIGYEFGTGYFKKWKNSEEL